MVFDGINKNISYSMYDNNYPKGQLMERRIDPMTQNIFETYAPIEQKQDQPKQQSSGMFGRAASTRKAENNEASIFSMVA